MRYIGRSLVHGSVCMLMISRIEMRYGSAPADGGHRRCDGQHCTLSGTDVTCDDGRTGQFAGDAIIWPDGTRSSPVQHPSVIIGNRPSVQVVPASSSAKATAWCRSTIQRTLQNNAPNSAASATVIEGEHALLITGAPE